MWIFLIPTYMYTNNRFEDSMAASKPVVLPGDDVIKEVECRVCLEQKQLRIITCGHKLCQDCIGKNTDTLL